MKKGKRLTEDEVIEVCKFYLKNQHMVIKQVAAHFGLSWKQVNRALNRGVIVTKILSLRVSPVSDPKDTRKTHQ